MFVVSREVVWIGESRLLDGLQVTPVVVHGPGTPAVGCLETTGVLCSGVSFVDGRVFVPLNLCTDMGLIMGDIHVSIFLFLDFKDVLESLFSFIVGYECSFLAVVFIILAVLVSVSDWLLKIGGRHCGLLRPRSVFGIKVSCL